MGKTPWVIYLWPGLPQIWKHGSWPSLALAVGCALLVNLALVTSLIWNELTAPGMRTIVWLAVISMWMISAAVDYGRQREQVSRKTGPRRQTEYETPFAEGLQYYLQKNWFEAERIFRRLLRRNARDTDARLMLASLLRHTKRFEEAQVQLDRLRLIEGSQKWEMEIGAEQSLLEDKQTQKGLLEPPATDRWAA